MNKKSAKASSRSNNGGAQQQSVRNLVRKEILNELQPKYLDVVSGPANMSFSGSIFSPLSGLARGDQANQLQGNRIVVNKLQCSFLCSTGQIFSNLRIIIFQWSDASIPVPTGILSTGTGTVTYPMSQLRFENLPLMKILHDEFFCLYLKGGSQATRAFRVTVYPKDPVKFSTTTTDPQKGGLYIMYASDDGVVSYPQITISTRVSFVEANKH